MNQSTRGSVCLLALLLPLVTGLAFDGGGNDLPDLEALLDRTNLSDVPEATSSKPCWPSRVRKCCPPGLKMLRVDAPDCKDEVTCRIPDWEESSGHVFTLTDSDDVYGFPTACPREDCPLVVLSGDSGFSAGPTPACVDKLVQMNAEGHVVSESIAAKVCGARDSQRQQPLLRTASATQVLKVAPILKCCPLHQMYDLAARLCVDVGPYNTSEYGEDGVASTAFASTEFRSGSVSPFLARVFDKPRVSFADVSVGFPRCEQVDLDVAVFELPPGRFLVDSDGNAHLSPAPRLNAKVGDTVSWVSPPGRFCVDEARNASGAIVVKVCREDSDEVCRLFGCFKKCCPHGSYFVPDGNTHHCKPKPPGRPLLPQVHLVPENDSAIPEYVPVSRQELVEAAYGNVLRGQEPQQVLFSSVTDNICPDFRYRLSQEMNDVWFFDQYGALYQPEYQPPERVVLQYCMEDSADVDGMSVLMCLPAHDPSQEEENSRILLITVGLLISCLFLAATLGTYCCLPALQNLHGKTLMCHVSSLLIAYLCLAMTQLLTKLVFLDNEWICSIIGNCVLFTFLSAFSWLNVMCFDIWRTFGAVKSSRSLKRSSASRRFRWYCAYAWGLSSAITTVCVIVDQWPGNDKSVFRPQMGDGSCWFRTDPEGKAYGIFIFFVGPLLVQTCSNLVLFVLTVRNYSRIKSEINRLRNPPTSRKVRKFEADSNKLKMNLKLFVVMGVTWVLELVSTFFPNGQAVFYLSDTANALQGVMIFAIFVLKRKVMRALGVRLGRAPPPATLSANPSLSIHADSRLAVRGKTASSSTLFTSEFRCSAMSNRNAETSQ